MKTKIVFMLADDHDAIMWLSRCADEHHLCAHAITRMDQISKMPADVYVIGATPKAQDEALALILTVRFNHPDAKVVLLSSWPEDSLYNVLVAANELTEVMPSFLDAGAPDAFDKLERIIIHGNH